MKDSGTYTFEPIAQVDSTNKELAEVAHNIEVMEQNIHHLQIRNAKQEDEINRLNNEALKKSIEFERLKSQLEITKTHLFKFLDEAESAFDSDEKFTSPEICRDYLDAAKFAQKYFNRGSLNSMSAIRRAEEWYHNYMPY